MVGSEATLEIRVLHRHDKSIRGIARAMGVSRNTVWRYLRDADAARDKPRPARPRTLDPFKGYIVERRRAAAPERIAGSVLLTELREPGYSGGYTMLKLLLASPKPKEAVEPAIRFETEPGQQMPGQQMPVDWAVIRRSDDRLLVFVATLGWSRATYLEFVADERVETLIETHENAFLAFAGTPREVLYDNMRTVVLERHGYGRGRHRFHPGCLDFARHCGFRLRLCAPYRAQTKGKSLPRRRPGRAVHPLPAAQLRCAACQPPRPGRADRRSGDRKPGGRALAARGGERSAARHHWRHPGRAAGDRANAVAAGADTLTAAAACARCKARSRCRSSACSDRIDTLEPQLSATAGLFPRLGEVDGVRRAEPHLPQLAVVLEPENPAFRASRTHLEKQPAAVAKVARRLVRSTASAVNFPIVRATATRYNPSLYPS
jgi:transposase